MNSVDEGGVRERKMGKSVDKDRGRRGEFRTRMEERESVIC